MSKKRRMFDIDVPPSEGFATEEPPARAPARRGPMASAISENVDSVKEREEATRSILKENEDLAREFVRLKKAGLVVDRIPLEKIVTEALVRDRKPGIDDDLDELKLSIREVGLSNPIRVEARADGMYELIQGMRRLQAFKALREETGEDRFESIPAGIDSKSGKTEDSYRRMVDENLIRKDISFAEMANLARAYAADPANGCPEVDDAVAVLFKSASYTKRSYIRSFAALLTRLGDHLAHPFDIPRNVGVDLKRRLENDPGLTAVLAGALAEEPQRSAAREVDILRRFAGGDDGAPILPTGKTGSASTVKPRKAKTTFQVSRGGGVAKCNASLGRLELRYDRDFSTIDRRDLERAVAAFLDVLDGKD